MATPFDNPVQTVYDPLAYHAGQPSAAFMFSPMPMLGSGSPPRFTGPFNFSTGMGSNGMSAMLQQFMPFLVQQLAGKGRMPAQFFPEQGFYEQMKAQAFFTANQQARQLATQADVAAMTRTIGGITQMMTGRPLTHEERVRNASVANATSQMMPILTQFMGPDMVDALHGSRGSAAIFASQMHSALRTSRDPITGAIGMSGVSAGNISRGVYENLFGANYNPATLRGMSAGQAGMLAQELQQRGLLGVPIGSMGLAERRAAIPSTLSDETYRRIARDIPSIQKLGENVTAAQLEEATNRVRDTHTKLRDLKSGPITAADIDNESKLPGGADILRTADASRITNRLKDLSGSVKAMREIFGDMGNPNAPMREIVDGLNKLTQGGLTTMSPEKLEMTVRRTQAIAKQTGISVEGIMAITDANAQLGDQLGLDRKYAPYNAQQSALFAGSAARTLHLDSGIYGQSTIEELQAADRQLRTYSTASPAANQMRAAMRMQKQGLITNNDPRLNAYLTAIKEHDTNYDFRMHDVDFLKMMEAGGVSRGLATTLLWDKSGNQELDVEYDVGGLVRGRATRADAINLSYGGAVRNSLTMASTAGRDELVRRGIIGRDNNLQNMLRGVSIGFMGDFFNTSAATFNKPEERKAAFMGYLKDQITRNLAKEMPGKTPAEVAAAAEAFLSATPGGLNALAVAAEAGVSRASVEDRLTGTMAKTFNTYGVAHEEDLKLSARQAHYDARMSKTYSGLGTAAPMQRLMNMFQGMGPEGITADKIMDVLGQVRTADVEFANPQGAFMTMLGLRAENEKLDLAKDADLAKFNFNADISDALGIGGDTAKKFLAAHANDARITGNPKLWQLLNEAITNPNVIEKALEQAPWLGSNVAQSELDLVSDVGTDAMTRLAERDAKGNRVKMSQTTSDVVGSYMGQSTGQAQRLLDDKYAMWQLGAGSSKDVQSIIGYNRELESMAAANGMTVAELLDYNPQARALFNKSAAMSQKIGEQYKKRDNAQMSAEEKAALAADRDFAMKYDTDAAKTEAAMKSILDVTAKDSRADIEAPSVKDALTKALADPARSTGVHRAAKARESILQMAIDKGMFGGKRGIDELTAEEMAKAEEGLSKMSLTDAERVKLKKLSGDSAMLKGLDSADGIRAHDLQKAIESIKAAPVAAERGNEKVEMNMVGSFEEKDTGRVLTVAGTGAMLAKALLSTISP